MAYVALTILAVPDTNERSKSTRVRGKRQSLALSSQPIPMSICERKKEIRRRRKRAEKLTKLKKRLPKATKSEQVEIARKVRDITPGAEVVIANWGLAAVDR